MLQKFELGQPFRALAASPFPEAGMGKRTIVYGHNGSGKSTFAEVLSQLEAGVLPDSFTWTHSDGTAEKLAPGTIPSGRIVSVFNKSYVQKNLSPFLDGEDARGIVRLGEDAARAEELEAALEVELATNAKELKDGLKALSTTSSTLKQLVLQVQDLIVGTIAPFDRSYTKSRYNAPTIRGLLAQTPDSQSLQIDRSERLQEMASGTTLPLSTQPDLAIPWVQISEDVTALLGSSVDSQLIPDLQGDVDLQDWIERGLQLHESRSDCGFCTSPLSATRRDELARHYDRSRSEVRSKAESLLKRTVDYRNALMNWRAMCPAADSVHFTVAEALTIVQLEQDSFVESALVFLDSIRQVALEKAATPENMSIAPPKAVLPDASKCGSQGIVQDHNAICSTQRERKIVAATAVLDSLVSDRALEFQELCISEAAMTASSQVLKERQQELAETLRAERAKQFTTQDMATQINSDLAAVYGRGYLTVEVSEDGKSYQCWRERLKATNLSDGERSTLALIYFLRQLEDETDVVIPESRVIVVDDPSSSLDRESVYATHSWLLTSLEKYGQYIILAHDFELLRLFLNALSNRISTSRGIIGKARKDGATPAEIEAAKREKLFPGATFLQMVPRLNASGLRSSTLEPIPAAIVNHKSEYHFLFERVMYGVDNPDDAETLLLLPNAARRLLESFSRFKAPNAVDFLPAMEGLAGKEFRDVYDFCNRYSHGEGRELSLNVDPASVHRLLGRCLDFVRHCDGNHYSEMRKAVGRPEPKVNTSSTRTRSRSSFESQKGGATSGSPPVPELLAEAEAVGLGA